MQIRRQEEERVIPGAALERGQGDDAGLAAPSSILALVNA